MATFGFLVIIYPIGCCRIKLELMKSGIAAFTRSEQDARKWWKSFYAYPISAICFLLGTAHHHHYHTMVGHFYDLGIRFLRDPGYLSELFPNRLYCYRFNEKGEERYVSPFILTFNPLYGWLSLVFWFWMVTCLLFQVTLIVQAIWFSHSKFCRFIRLKRFFPTVDEKLLRQLSAKDYSFCYQLEYFDFYASRKDFREFLDHLVKRNYFTTRVRRITTPSNGNENPNVLALVAIFDSNSKERLAKIREFREK